MGEESCKSGVNVVTGMILTRLNQEGRRPSCRRPRRRPRAPHACTPILAQRAQTLCAPHPDIWPGIVTAPCLAEIAQHLGKLALAFAKVAPNLVETNPAILAATAQMCLGISPALPIKTNFFESTTTVRTTPFERQRAC